MFNRLYAHVVLANDVKLNQNKRSVMMNPMSSEAININYKFHAGLFNNTRTGINTTMIN